MAENMAENLEDRCKISLRHQNKTISSISCTLKVPNFFTLPQYKKRSFDVTSPSFNFAFATWCFQFSADRFVEDDEDDDDDVYDLRVFARITRLHSQTPRQKIFSTITLLDDDEEVSRQEDHIYKFDGDERKTMSYLASSYFNFARRDNLTVIIVLASPKTEFPVDQLSTAPQRGILLRQDFKDVLLNGQDHNITFNICDRKIKAHRDILKARSDIFHSTLSQDMLEKNSGVIDLPDCDPQAFEQFLFYVYTGETKELNEKNMFGLYYIADKYSFIQLKEECSAFIKSSLSSTNIRHVIELAAKHGDTSLMDFAMNYFTSNANVIWPSGEWQLFLKENYAAANEFITKSFQKSVDHSAKRLKTS